jgi:hypothetical protein
MNSDFSVALEISRIYDELLSCFHPSIIGCSSYNWPAIVQIFSENADISCIFIYFKRDMLISLQTNRSGKWQCFHLSITVRYTMRQGRILSSNGKSTCSSRRWQTGSIFLQKINQQRKFKSKGYEDHLWNRKEIFEKVLMCRWVHAHLQQFEDISSLLIKSQCGSLVHTCITLFFM